MSRSFAVVALLVCILIPQAAVLHAAEVISDRHRDAPTPQELKSLQHMPQAVRSKQGRMAVAGAAAAAATGSFVEEHPFWTAFFALLAIAMAGAAISERLKKPEDPGIGAQVPVAQATGTGPVIVPGHIESAQPISPAPASSFTASILGAFRSLAIKFAYFLALVVAVVGAMWLLMLMLR